MLLQIVFILFWYATKTDILLAYNVDMNIFPVTNERIIEWSHIEFLDSINRCLFILLISSDKV